jgi:hypothetical protein
MDVILSPRRAKDLACSGALTGAQRLAAARQIPHPAELRGFGKTSSQMVRATALLTLSLLTSLFIRLQ